MVDQIFKIYSILCVDSVGIHLFSFSSAIAQGEVIRKCLSVPSGCIDGNEVERLKFIRRFNVSITSHLHSYDGVPCKYGWLSEM